MRIPSWNSCAKIFGIMAIFSVILIASSLVVSGSNEEKAKGGKKALKIRAKPSVISKVEKAKPDDVKMAPKQIYTVYLINKSAVWTCIGVKAGAGGWVMLPQPIGQTCNLASCQACFDAGRYLPILAVDCNSASFAMYVMLRNSGGEVVQAGPATIQPGCDALGEVVCLDIP